MDLPGPKLRTGPTESVSGVIKVQPERDRFGNVTRRAKVWLTAIESPEPAFIDADAVLTVPKSWLSDLNAGQRIKFFDARGKARILTVSLPSNGNRVAETDQTCYVTSETIFQWFSRGISKKCQVGEIPTVSQPIILKPGDVLHLSPTDTPDPTSARDEHGRYLKPPAIGVTLPEYFPT